jgi:hypothetical protein
LDITMWAAPSSAFGTMLRNSIFRASPGSAPLTAIGPVAGPLSAFASNAAASRSPSKASQVSTSSSSPESIVMAGDAAGSRK